MDRDVGQAAAFCTQVKAEFPLMRYAHLLSVRHCTSLAAAVLMLSIGAVQVSGARGSLFESVAGAWSGVGTVTVSGGNPERLRCLADYAPSGPTRLRISLRCASDSFKLQVSSDIVQQGNQVVGSWSEATTGVSGDVAGTVGPSQLQVSVSSGTGVTGRLTLVLRGGVQSVTLSSEGPVSANASVVLNRS